MEQFKVINTVKSTLDIIFHMSAHTQLRYHLRDSVSIIL